MEELSNLLRRAFELLQSGKLDDARRPLEQAHTLAPDSLDANAMLGFIAARQKRWSDASRYYVEASRLQPSDFNLALSAGEATFFTADVPAATPLLRRALSLAPTDQRALYALGKALSLGDDPVSAIPLLQSVHSTGHNPAEVKVWLAQALRNSGRPDEALKLLREAAQLSPANMEIRAQVAITMNYAAGVTAREVFEAHREYARMLEASVRDTPRPKLTASRGPRPEKLRIGLLSPDLKRHSVSFFLLPIVENINRSRFEFCCYHALAEEDAFTERYKRSSTLFRNIHGLDGVAISEQIAADNVHILMDLAGHTSNTRMPLLALRAAPVQMTYLGYPNTTGLAACDWRITDTLTDPPAHQALHTERLLSVDPCAHTYEPLGGWDNLPAATPPPCLTNGYTTFACFSAIQKFSDELISMLAKAVLATPDSKLLVKLKLLGSPAAQSEMRARFTRAGLRDDARILLEGPVPRGEDMLAEYLRADVVLDTFPYHGTTTTCECLSVGVPVITRVGNRTCARVGLSLLSAVGLADLAAEDEPAFINAARTLAADTDRLKALRTNLRVQARRSLGDHQTFCHAFERALDRAWLESR